MKTPISEIITNIRYYLADLQSTTFTTIELIGLLNKSLAEVQLTTSYYIDSSYITFGEGTPAIDLHEVALRIDRVEYNFEKLPVTSVDDMDTRKPDWRKDTANKPERVVVQYNKPSTFYLYPRVVSPAKLQGKAQGAMTGIYPVCDAPIIVGDARGNVITGIDTTNLLLVHYVKRFPEITSVEDAIEATIEFRSAVEHLVTFKALVNSGTSERIQTATVYNTLYLQDIELLRKMKTNNFRKESQDMVYRGFI